jgi:hypothetical protein
MKMWILRGVVLCWIIITGYWLLPLKKPKTFRADFDPTAILATQQMSAVSYDIITIKGGKLNIPDSLIQNYPNLRTDEAYIIGSSPFRKSKSALMYSYDFIMSGNVTGVIKNEKNENIAIFHIEEWFPTQYIARFWKLTGYWEILYLVNLNFGLPLLLYYFLAQGSTLRKLF